MEKEGEPRRRRRVRKPHCQPLVLVALAPAAEAEAQIGETLHPGNKSVQIFTLTKNAVVDIYVYDGIYVTTKAMWIGWYWVGNLEDTLVCRTTLIFHLWNSWWEAVICLWGGAF